MSDTFYLFHLNTYNDTDHIAPVIFEFLKNKEKVRVIYLSDYDYENDYRIKLFQNNPYFSVSRASRIEFFKNKIANNNVLAKNIRKIFPAIVNRIISRFLNRDLVNAACLFYEWGGPNKLNFCEARYLSVPIICLPHGFNIYKNYDVNVSIRNKKSSEGNWPDFSNRNSFDQYIVQTKRHRQGCIEWGQNSEKVSVWGSARFDPGWAKKNLGLMEDFNPKLTKHFRLKIVFFLPHWDYNVDKIKTLEAINEISSDTSIYLVIKGHTRGTGSIDKKSNYKFLKKTNVMLNENANSPAIIKWSDVVINFGSSIGIDALLQGKNVIFPIYLHSNKTIFDDGKVVHIAKNSQGLTELLKKAKKSELSYPEKKYKDELMKREIFGDKLPHDVPSQYYKYVKKNYIIHR